FLARELLSGLDWMGAFQVVMGEEAPLAGIPNLALRAERAPNAMGAELLGYRRDYAAALAAAESAALVLVLDEPEVAVRTAGALLYIGTVLPEGARGAEAVLPIANVAEEEGTFVNRDGRVQRYLQAKPPPGMARPAWWVLSELLATAQRGDHPATPADAFDLLAATVPAFAGLSYASLGLGGQGPNRVGPQGLLQPAADGLKNLMKEETLPAQADKALFLLAPAMSFVPALLTFAVIPFAAPLPTPWGDVDMVVANLPVGFLYILAFSSLGVYGIVLAGWSSNNKYSLLGGLRASAQMISYEIALGMSTVAVLLLAGNVTLSDLTAGQAPYVFKS